MLEDDNSEPVANEARKKPVPKNRVVDDLVVDTNKTDKTGNEFLDEEVEDDAEREVEDDEEREVEDDVDTEVNEDDAYGEVNEEDAVTTDEKRGEYGSSDVRNVCTLV